MSYFERQTYEDDFDMEMTLGDEYVKVMTANMKLIPILFDAVRRGGWGVDEL
jgi:hypothetical protein